MGPETGDTRGLAYGFSRDCGIGIGETELGKAASREEMVVSSDV